MRVGLLERHPTIVLLFQPSVGAAVQPLLYARQSSIAQRADICIAAGVSRGQLRRLGLHNEGHVHWRTSSV